MSNKTQSVDETVHELATICIDPSEILSSLMNATITRQAYSPAESAPPSRSTNLLGSNNPPPQVNKALTSDNTPATPTIISTNISLPTPLSFATRNQIPNSNIAYAESEIPVSRMPQNIHPYSTLNNSVIPNMYPYSNFYFPATTIPHNPSNPVQPRPYPTYTIPSYEPQNPVNLVSQSFNPHIPLINEFTQTTPRAMSTHQVPSMPKYDLLPTKMDKWRLSFNGTDMPVEKFIFQVEHLALTNSVPEQQLVNGLHLFLKGVPRDHYWVMLQQNSHCTWPELKASLLHRFKVRRSDIEIRQCIDNRKQKFNESFIEFYYSIHELAQPLINPLNDKELLEILRKNMCRELKLHLAGQFINTLPDLLSICTNVEDVWKNVNYIPESARVRPPNHRLNAFSYDTYSNTEIPANSEVEHPNIEAIQSHTGYSSNQNLNNQSKPSCWNCQRQDHLWWHCDTPLKIFCFGCGVPDVLLPHCLNCNRTGNWKPGMGRPGYHSQPHVPKQNSHPSNQNPRVPQP